MDKKSDYALQSIVELYSVLCNTIEDSSKTIGKNKVPIKSALYDYINNYLIYAAPFILLKTETEDRDQLAHDCYILTKNIIENSEISPSSKTSLLRPLKESGIYIFTSKVFKLNHLNGYSNFLNSILSINENYEGVNKVLFLKDLLRPVVLFLVTGFPLKKNDAEGLKENIQYLDKYIEFQISVLLDIFLNIAAYGNNITKEKPEHYTAKTIKSIYRFMKENNYNEETLKYSSTLLEKIYSILFEEHKNKSKINTIFKTIRDYQSSQFKIDNPEANNHKELKSLTGAVKNVTGTKRKSKKTSTTVSRK